MPLMFYLLFLTSCHIIYQPHRWCNS